MAFSYLLLLVTILTVFYITEAQQQHLNPSILQDSRNLPQVDGTFGFLYRTEDGIAHGAVGDRSGSVHGRFTYTDPSGSKINYNYNTGSVRPGSAQSNTERENIPPPAQPVYRKQPERQPYDAREEDAPVYEQPRVQNRPKPKKNPRPAPQTVDYGSYSI